MNPRRQYKYIYIYKLFFLNNNCSTTSTADEIVFKITYFLMNSVGCRSQISALMKAGFGLLDEVLFSQPDLATPEPTELPRLVAHTLAEVK